MLRKDGPVHWHRYLHEFPSLKIEKNNFNSRALPGEAYVHRQLRGELLHGEPRLHGGGPPARAHVLLRDGRVQRGRGRSGTSARGTGLDNGFPFVWELPNFLPDFGCSRRLCQPVVQVALEIVAEIHLKLLYQENVHSAIPIFQDSAVPPHTLELQGAAVQSLFSLCSLLLAQ